MSHFDKITYFKQLLKNHENRVFKALIFLEKIEIL